jgi:hypothetical protein
VTGPWSLARPITWSRMTDREFIAVLDRLYRDCVVYAWILWGDEAGDLGGAMFEVGFVDIIRWQQEDHFV